MTKVPSWFCWGLRWSRRSTTPLLLLQSLTSSFSSLSSLTLRLLHKIPSQESNSKSPVLKFIILLFSKPILIMSLCRQNLNINNTKFPEPWPWLEEPDLHLPVPVRVEPVEEHLDDLRDLPHDEHHHGALPRHPQSIAIPSRTGALIHLIWLKSGLYCFIWLFGSAWGWLWLIWEDFPLTVWPPNVKTQLLLFSEIMIGSHPAPYWHSAIFLDMDPIFWLSEPLRRFLSCVKRHVVLQTIRQRWHKITRTTFDMFITTVLRPVWGKSVAL